MSNLHLIPELIKNIVWKLNPQNKIVNANERWMAVQQLEAIAEFCTKAVNQFNSTRKK